MEETYGSSLLVETLWSSLLGNLQSIPWWPIFQDRIGCFLSDTGWDTVTHVVLIKIVCIIVAKEEISCNIQHHTVQMSQCCDSIQKRIIYLSQVIHQHFYTMKCLQKNLFIGIDWQVSYTDLKNLANTKVFIPTTFMESWEQINNLKDILTVKFGNIHPSFKE